MSLLRKQVAPSFGMWVLRGSPPPVAAAETFSLRKSARCLSSFFGFPAAGSLLVFGGRAAGFDSRFPLDFWKSADISTLDGACGVGVKF